MSTIIILYNLLSSEKRKKLILYHQKYIMVHCTYCYCMRPLYQSKYIKLPIFLSESLIILYVNIDFTVFV